VGDHAAVFEATLALAGLITTTFVPNAAEWHADLALSPSHLTRQSETEAHLTLHQL
jgi:hypothetical protein